MPITIKSNTFKYKKPEGDYSGIDVIAERTTSEQIASIQNAAAAARESIPEDYTALSDDVSDLKSALDDSNTLLLTDSTAGPSSTLTLGQYRSLENNALQRDPAYAFGGSLATTLRKATTMTDATYEFAVNCYSGTPVSSATLIKGYGWFKAGTMFVIPDGAVAIACQVHRVDGQAITSDETDTIKSAWKYFLPTDTTLSTAGKIADAKATGDAIAAIANTGKFYKIADDTALVSTAAGVIALYDALVAARPDLMTKNTLSSGTLSNYEYVLTIGNYNIAGRRSRDAVIAKPKILISAGTHGYERSAVMSLYRIVKSICDNDYQLGDIIDFPEFHIIPIVCQWGYTNNSRVNENGVNINRNFNTTDWTQSSEGQDYSGAAPGDQPETQIVQDWLTANNDAVLYIDWHNSSFTDEISCLLGASDATSVSIKRDYLFGINCVIPYWQKARNLDTSNIYGYTGESATPGTAKTFGTERGIHSFTLETSWDVASNGKHSNFSIATGAEAFGNFLKGITEILR